MSALITRLKSWLSATRRAFVFVQRSQARSRSPETIRRLPAINGATRFEVGVDGVAGHAGATPMSLRRDALTAAAEMMLAIEERARREPDLVATVGRLEAWPGAANVIPGHVQFSIDIRAPVDANRATAMADIGDRMNAIAAARSVSTSLIKTHEANAFACDAGIIAGLKKAVEAVGIPP